MGLGSPSYQVRPLAPNLGSFLQHLLSPYGSHACLLLEKKFRFSFPGWEGLFI